MKELDPYFKIDLSTPTATSNSKPRKPMTMEGLKEVLENIPCARSALRQSIKAQEDRIKILRGLEMDILHFHGDCVPVSPCEMETLKDQGEMLPGDKVFYGHRVVVMENAPVIRRFLVMDYSS